MFSSQNLKPQLISLTLLLAVNFNLYAIDIKQWATNNGATVLFIETHALKMVDVRVVFDAGSARDGKQFGLARLTNALMPTGTKNLTEEQISLAFENHGAIFGNQSLRDMSIFTLRTLSDKNTLRVTSSTLANIILSPIFPQPIFERELSTTLQTIKQLQQSPSYLASTAFMQASYKNHPYANPPIGTPASLKTITTDNLVEFHRQYFIGKNATVVIVGDLNLIEAKSLANQIIGKLPVGKKPPKIAKVAPLKSSIERKINFPSQQIHILMGQPGIARNEAGYFPLYVGNHILGGSGLVSRLSTEIREKLGLAYSVYSYFSPMRAKGPFRIGAQTKGWKQTLAIIKKTLVEFIKIGPSTAELVAAKKNIAGSFALMIDSNKKISEYLALIGFYNLPLDYLDTLVDKTNQVTVNDIKQAWQQKTNPEKMVVILVGNFSPISKK